MLTRPAQVGIKSKVTGGGGTVPGKFPGPVNTFEDSMNSFDTELENENQFVLDEAEGDKELAQF
jgi:hypothetical protein